MQLAALVTHTGCLVCLNFYIHVMLPMLANFEAFWTQAQYGNRLCRRSIINRSSNFHVPLRLKGNKRILYPTNADPLTSRNPGESPQNCKQSHLTTYLPVRQFQGREKTWLLSQATSCFQSIISLQSNQIMQPAFKASLCHQASSNYSKIHHALIACFFIRGLVSEIQPHDPLREEF